ncbi:signal transduction histidine-protein kinase BarA [Colletotrichum spaethianum]|uniref:Signal recognition particle subunit SRP72 n=1 Tax=Colletotrichum spaethianum TaxID=700344 RepID=A0AA37PAY0_9PEZI|nr:signal transduction histidine-protein kinase BarA [Colletotrichum spaethianum]GKT48835.1 signal transduction histidine-protein kinase BarA [Colletotrichum spaethianum]
MPSDPAANLGALLRAASIEDHEEVLKAANATLKASKTDLVAQQTRVVALLKLDRFDDALRAIADGGSKLEDTTLLEKAYALYKTGKLQEAREIANSKPWRSYRHLVAQVAYRAEDFKDALSVYTSLLEEPQGEDSDLKINQLASAAQLEWKSSNNLDGDDTPIPTAEDADTFELAYNIACGTIARGDLSKAMVLLQRALRLCDESEELSEDDKKAEMIPIMVQQVYVYSRLGKADQALEIQKRLSISDDWDAESRLIALNNKSALANEVKNPYLAQREVDAAAALSKEAKLFRYQESQLKRNKYILGLHSQKFDGVYESTSRVLADAAPTVSVDTNSLSAINATARALRHSKTVDVKDVLPLLEKRPTDVGLLLTTVQLYLTANNPGAALSVLESFLQNMEKQGTSEVRFSPGLVALTVSLYRQQGRHGSVRSELAKASSFWEKRDGRHVDSLLRGAGSELLKSSDLNDLTAAGAAFEKLCQKPSADRAAGAGLVASFATSNRAKVTPPAPIDDLLSSIDVEQLVRDGVVTLATPAGQAKKRRLDAQPTEKANKKKRRRKLPKDYVEGKKMDPERWLPLRDRSSYRPKGKKGKKKANEATQGGFVKEEETLELAGGAGSVKVEKAPTSSSKKKKKGKK